MASVLGAGVSHIYVARVGLVMILVALYILWGKV